MKTALLLIDIQNDYFMDGKSQLFHAEDAAYHASEILDSYRKEGLPVIHVKHINNKEGASFFLPNSTGSEINKMVAPRIGELVITKHAPNAFYKTELREVLETLQIEHLTVCGMMTHMCIDTTVRAAKDYGYEVTLIQDACATKDLMGVEGMIPAHTVHHTFIAALNGAFADIMSTKDFIINYFY